MTKFLMLDICLIVMKAAGESFSTGITLLVDGTIISGDLIHPIAYFKGVAEMLEATKDEPPMNIAKIVAEKLRETIEEVQSSEPTQNEEKNTETEVLHLKNLKIWTPHDTPMAYNKGFISLRVDAIDGFIWGTPSIDAMD